MCVSLRVCWGLGCWMGVLGDRAESVKGGNVFVNARMPELAGKGTHFCGQSDSSCVAFKFTV